MSSITNTIRTVWTSQSGQLRGDVNAISGGMRNVASGGRQAAGGLSLMQQQMRALGTTIRYAFAGTAVFGSLQLVRNLSQLQQQLGLMEALTLGTPQNLSKGIGGFTTALLKGSVEALTPVQELNDSVINLLSTVQNVPRNEVVEDVVRLSQAAKLTNTDVTALTQGITTMNNAFGRSNKLADIQRMTAVWTKMLFNVPGGREAGPQIITQMPQIAALARTANISPGATFGLLSALLRFGFKGPQAGPGMTRLLQTLTFTGSNVKESEGALQEAGITTESVRQKGGLWAIQQLITHAQGLGIGGNLTQARKRAMASPTDLIDAGSIRDLGLSGAGIEFLGRVFHRVQGLRAFIAILARATAPFDKMSPNLKQDIDDLVGIFEDVRAGTDYFTARWKKVADRSKLAETAQQFEAATLQIATQMEPVINAATVLPRKAAQAVTEHPDLAKGVGIAGAVLAGTLGLNVLTGGRLGRALGRHGLAGKLFGGILGGAGQAALMAKAADDAMQNVGSKVLGSSPLNPLYVIVVGQLLPDPLRSGTDLDKIAGGLEQDAIGMAGRRGGIRGAISRIGKRVGFGGNLAGKGLTAVGLFSTAWWAAQQMDQPGFGKSGAFDESEIPPSGRPLHRTQRAQAMQWYRSHRAQFPLLSRLLAAAETDPALRRRLPTGLDPISQTRGDVNIQWLNAWEKMLERANTKAMRTIAQDPKAGLDITIVADTGKGKKTTKVHIPPEINYAGGRIPQTRGRGKTKKVTTYVDMQGFF